MHTCACGKGGAAPQTLPPPTLQAWEDALFRAKGLDGPGLTWCLAQHVSPTLQEAQQALIRRLDELLVAGPCNAVGLENNALGRAPSGV